MYVCVCKAVTESQLENAIVVKGMCTRKQLTVCFGVGRDCGKCNKDVHNMLQCHHQQKMLAASHLAQLNQKGEINER